MKHILEQTSVRTFLQHVHTQRALPFITKGMFAAGFGPLSDRMQGLPFSASLREGPGTAQMLELYLHYPHGDKSARLYFPTQGEHENDYHVPTLVVGQSKSLERLAKHEGVVVNALPQEGVIYKGADGEVVCAEDVRAIPEFAEFFGKEALYYALRKSTFVLNSVSILSLPDRRMLRVAVFQNQLGKPDEFSALIHNVDPDVPLFTTADGTHVYTVNVTNAQTIRRHRNLVWEQIN